MGAVHRGEHRLENGCQFVVHGIGVPQRLDGLHGRVVFDDAVRQPHGTVIGSHVVIRFAQCSIHPIIVSRVIRSSASVFSKGMFGSLTILGGNPLFPP